MRGSNCHCGGQCNDCRIDDLQRQILDIADMQTMLSRDLETSRGLLSLSKSLTALTGEYQPRAVQEENERDLRRRLEEIAAERQQLLEELCRICPTCEECQIS